MEIEGRISYAERLGLFIITFFDELSFGPEYMYRYSYYHWGTVNIKST